MTEKIDWQAEDKKYIWHPAMQMKDNEVFPPVVIDHAKGVYLYDTEGKPYLDIISSWWCNLLGHCNPEINEALKRQINTLEHVIFTNFSHKPAIELSRELAELLPKGLTKFTYHDNGSSAVEAAMKMAYQYHNQTGHPERQKFMCLDSSYHGETIGALSVGSMDDYAGIFHPLLMDNIHFKGLDCYRCPYGKTRETCNIECFESAEEAFEKFGKETAGVSPDILCTSKGLTAGYMPMSITVTTDKVYDAFYDDYGTHKAFVHSHTYAGNPMGCAIAFEVLKIMKRDHILDKVNEDGKYLHEELMKALGHHKNVGEIRHIGLINAIELVEDPATKKAFPAEKRIGWHVFRKAIAKGLVLRPMGDVIYFNPPLNISREDLDKGVALCKEAVEAVLGE